MLEWMPFFKTVRPMTREGLLEIAQSVSYQFCEPGETIFKQGDLPESYYVILKGRIQASIPDPKGDGIIEPKNLEAEEICEDSEMPQDPNRPLNESEIDQLPKYEQKRYLTKIMFDEMLKNRNIARKTTSPGVAIGISS